MSNTGRNQQEGMASVHIYKRNKNTSALRSKNLPSACCFLCVFDEQVVTSSTTSLPLSRTTTVRPCLPRSLVHLTRGRFSSTCRHYSTHNSLYLTHHRSHPSTCTQEEAAVSLSLPAWGLPPFEYDEAASPGSQGHASSSTTSPRADHGTPHAKKKKNTKETTVAGGVTVVLLVSSESARATPRWQRRRPGRPTASSRGLGHRLLPRP